MCAALQAKLEGGGEWQRRLKALSVVEALLKADDAHARAHFVANAAAVHGQLASAQASVKEKARKTLILLGVEGVPEAAARSSAGRAAGQNTSSPSLLDLDEAPPPRARPLPQGG